ncbi:MAG: His/Gly/Thr/Pro-type tRNA ligase C-terminal domain-containing protein [Candidatus Paceibacterota bacterium]
MAPFSSSSSEERNAYDTATIFPESLPLLDQFDTAAEIAMYYGFAPIQTPSISRDDRADSKRLHAFDRSAFVCAPEEKTSLLRLYHANKFHKCSYPLLVYYPRSRNATGVPADSNVHVGLDVIGASHSVADALTIQTAYCILKEEGYENMIVDINSIGDRDTVQRFERALIQFYRDRISELPPKYHEILKNDPFDMLQFTGDPVCQQLNDDAPNAISFLTDASRHHFMDVLEHLEELGVPYRIKNTLVGNRNISSQTVFSIREVNDELEETTPPLAMGTRYNRLSRKIRLGHDISAVGISLSYAPRRKSARGRKTPLQPRHFFAHLGDIARQRSLALIDELRLARIPVYHSLVRDKIREQLARAEHLDLPYVIIMGQKEAMENVVVVRNSQTRAQVTVPVPDLVAYLKRHAM